MESLSQYHSEIEILIKRIQDLSRLGIEDSNIALPKICVVGDQSTGKSSLIESISEINVPRSSGTCTRCPMEINLSQSEPNEGWRCSIYLSTRYQYRTLAKIPRKGLGPWIKCDRDHGDDLFATLTAKDQDQIQDAIKWAQLATLNPNADFNDYKPDRNEDTSTNVEVKFSPNVVRVDVSAPGFPTLSFYDLPGVINQPEQDDEKYLVTLVENLVKDYVSQKNCIVLLTLQMTDDPTNSSAARIIRDIKDAKDRTLGVLTKPDKLDGRESHDQWKDVLNGSKFKLGRGYYVVRNNPSPFTIDHNQSRLEEKAFFSQSLWAYDLKDYQERFGTPNLVDALTSILKEQILACLPSIIDQISAEAHRIDEELITLPQPPANNVQGILIKKILQLGMRINGLFGGESGSRMFQRTWSKLMDDLEKVLRTTRPKLRTNALIDEQNLLEKIQADGEKLRVCTPRKKRPAPTVEPDNAADAPVVVKSDRVIIKSDRNENAPIRSSIFDKCSVEGYLFTMEDVQEIRRDCQSGAMPNHVGPKAYDIMYQLSIKHWSKISKVFVNAVYDHVDEILAAAVDEELSQYKQTELYRNLHGMIKQFMDQIREEQLEDIMKFDEIQYCCPLTRAQEKRDEEIKKAFKALKCNREKSRARCYLRLDRQPVDDESLLNNVVETKLGPDPFGQEVEMVAVSLLETENTYQS